jgi:dihydropteroate synthase
MILQCRDIQLDLTQARIMGIVNVTPDSFSDGGQHSSTANAVHHALSLIEQGAAVVDIGGESTRPGAADVPVQQELDRVMPVIQALRGCGAVISVDTRKPEVMRAAIAEGAQMINDINALQADGALAVLIHSDVAVCLMHKQGQPATMQQAPAYVDVVKEVKDFLAARLAAASEFGVARNRIVLDPGFGFGKSLQHNLKLLHHLDRFTELGVPILVGLSRKSMLGKLTGRAVDERDYAGGAALVMAVLKGARMIRVHNVAACADALKIIQAVEASDE